MHDLDYPQGLAAEALCQELVNLLLAGYDVHFAALPKGLCGLVISQGQNDEIARDIADIENIGLAMAHVYVQVPEVKK